MAGAKFYANIQIHYGLNFSSIMSWDFAYLKLGNDSAPFEYADKAASEQNPFCFYGA